MKKGIVAALLILLGGPGLTRGQFGGNISFSESGQGGKARAEEIERDKRVLTKDELPPTGTSTFVECSVLMNVKADEYIAVFGITQDGATVGECSEAMDVRVKAFSAELELLGIGDDDLFVDFAAQNRIYGYEPQGEILREKLVGFELKKNVSIRYTDAALLERITLAAARSDIFDLIKVDYVVQDMGPIQDRLMAEAAVVAKNKISRYENLLGIKLQAPAQVYTERSSIHYPTQMYDSYTAFESEEIDGGFNRSAYTVQTARKSRTFFFNGLSADGFDVVINPVVIEPVVQFTLYLKLKYEVDQPAAH